MQGGRGVGVHEGSGETEGELEHDLSPDWTIWGRDERRLSEKRIYYACSCHLGGKRIDAVHVLLFLRQHGIIMSQAVGKQSSAHALTYY